MQRMETEHWIGDRGRDNSIDRIIVLVRDTDGKYK